MSPAARALLPLAFALPLSACGPKASPLPAGAAALPDRYATSLLHLGTGFAAKEACACIFVHGRDEDTCRAWIKVSPDVARIRVSPEDREVRAKALGGWETVATWGGPGEGCRLEPLRAP